MSLTKKDPSLRVAANDPHLVSLGGGRLSTAVTIHYIPIGDMTIGSSTDCSISLNGTGVRPIHCTIYRSEENEVTIVPEREARILIDGTKITQETNLTQGAMITIGNSNYLRFNNPAEAQMMRSAMGSNERISMPQIDFTQVPQRNSTKSVGSSSNGSGGGGSGNGIGGRKSMELDAFYDEFIRPSNMMMERTPYGYGSPPHAPIDINGLQCPKVFTADLVTVNMPAKDVLGQKYANFARNLAENHRNDKNVNNAIRNQQMSNNLRSSPSMSNAPGNYVNIPNISSFIQNVNSNSTPPAPTPPPTTSQSNGHGFGHGPGEGVAKMNNNASPLRMANASSHHHNVPAYDRYPKPGTYGGLQIFPMNGINTEINNGSPGLTASPQYKPDRQESSTQHAPTFELDQRHNASYLKSENERVVEDMLKICMEYQNQTFNSLTSSPIVQNRIKTNGSLPREKKSPFHHDLSSSSTSGNNSSNAGSSKPHNTTSTPIPTSTGYENVRIVGQNRVEINGQLACSVPSASGSVSASPSSLSPTSSTRTGYENVVLGKYVPQSPRTKIRTTCMSPKKEHSYSNAFGQTVYPPIPNPKPIKQNEYEQLIKTFEEKLKLEMQAIEESSRYRPPPKSTTATTTTSADHTPVRRLNKNINNLTLNLHEPSSLQNSPKPNKKPAPAPRIATKTVAGPLMTTDSLKATEISKPQLLLKTTIGKIDDIDQLKKLRREFLGRIQTLNDEISELQKQEDEVLRELDMENALVTAEVNSMGNSLEELENQLKSLQSKIHRLEAQRNATRVMEENQQAKLKQSIEMKQDQIMKLKEMLKQKPNNECLKEELHNVKDSLENDRKNFEDLEFQYLEEESEWHACREELHGEEKTLALQIENKQQELRLLEKQELSGASGSGDAKALKNKLHTLFSELKECQENVKAIESTITDISGQLNVNSSDDEGEGDNDDKLSASTASASASPPLPGGSIAPNGVMSQSLFGSAELLCPKRGTEDLMSKSVNENMFYNNNIELPTAQATSTPKRPQLKVVDIDDVDSVDITATTNESGGDDQEQTDPLLRLKYNMETGEELTTSQSERIKFNLSLGSDDFEVNPLEKRVPSQDDIDRISKVTSDAPITTKGATTKIFDSIMEIERNRQLLLAQQGHHVIEHERQKINDLKKKCHDEARAQYLQMLHGGNANGNNNCSAVPSQQQLQQQQASRKVEQKLGVTANDDDEASSRLTAPAATYRVGGGRKNDNQTKEQQSARGEARERPQSGSEKKTAAEERKSLTANSGSQGRDVQRHSQPEFELQYKQQQQQQPQQQPSTTPQHSRLSPRPLSETNSELSYDDLLAERNGLSKSCNELEVSTISNRYSGAGAGEHIGSGGGGGGSGDECNTKRSSVNSNDTNSGGSGGSGHSERKRALPKHQRPLTRYLPIFSSDLNLRHHIESAGHQIALCPHVFVDAYSCRGYLHKLGATFHGWSRRWFVLDRQRNAFIYYSDKSERKPRGGAYFSTIDEVYLDHLNASKSGRPHCTFIVKTKKRSYHLQAASDAAARIWIDAIITGAQGNLDY